MVKRFLMKIFSLLNDDSKEDEHTDQDELDLLYACYLSEQNK